jgi:hypothetical protein
MLAMMQFSLRPLANSLNQINITPYGLGLNVIHEVPLFADLLLSIKAYAYVALLY